MISSDQAASYSGLLNAFAPTRDRPIATTRDCRAVRTEHIDSDRMEPGACFDCYRDSERDMYDVFATTVPPQQMRMQVATTHITEMGFSRFSASVHGVRRTPAHVRKTPIEALRVRLYRAGVTHAVCADQPVIMQAGAIHILDYSRPSDAISADVDQISMYIPHNLIGYDPARHPAYWKIDVNHPLGRIIANSMETFEQQLPGLTEDQAPAVAEGLRGLLAGGLSGGLHSHNDHPIRAARAAAMRRHLDMNLRDPQLGLATLMVAFGASRATIFHDFADHGGVDRFITNRRLDRAFVDLAESPGVRGAVARVAEEFGFSSTSHFSRLFLDRFGCRPGGIVGMRTC